MASHYKPYYPLLLSMKITFGYDWVLSMTLSIYGSFLMNFSDPGTPGASKVKRPERGYTEGAKRGTAFSGAATDAASSHGR